MTKKNNPLRKVRCNLLQAEVYVRYPVCLIDGAPVRRYCELQEQPCSNGIIEHCVEVDYPITPESVNSFADSADYKKNPEVINQAVSRQNLGDISEIQKVLSHDLSAMRDMLAQSQEVLKKVQAVQGQNVDKAKNENSQNVDKGEVNNG